MGKYERSEIEILFRNYYRYKRDVEGLIEKVARMEAAATKITPNFSADVPAGPRTGPPTSRVEKYAIRITMARETIADLEKLINATDELFEALRPHQRYLIKCIECNRVSPKEFAKQNNMNVNTIRVNLNNIYKKLAEL